MISVPFPQPTEPPSTYEEESEVNFLYEEKGFESEYEFREHLKETGEDYYYDDGFGTPEYPSSGILPSTTDRD